MTSFLSFLKRHKVGVIVLAIIIVIIIIAAILLKMILGNFGLGEAKTPYNPKWLEEAERAGLKTETLDKIVSTLKENEKVKTATYQVSGITIKFILDVKDGMSKDDAKKLGTPILGALSEEVKKAYSLQLYISCKEASESEVYPMSAYKHRTSSDFVW